MCLILIIEGGEYSYGSLGPVLRVEVQVRQSGGDSSVSVRPAVRAR
jgi:hypothetical protein